MLKRLWCRLWGHNWVLLRTEAVVYEFFVCQRCLAPVPIRELTGEQTQIVRNIGSETVAEEINDD